MLSSYARSVWPSSSSMSSLTTSFTMMFRTRQRIASLRCVIISFDTASSAGVMLLRWFFSSSSRRDSIASSGTSSLK